MDSPLTSKLKSSTDTVLKLIDYLTKYFNISTYHIVTYSIILNAFGVLSLLNKEFILFIVLFITTFYIQLVAKMYKRKTNDQSTISKLYGRLSVWIIFLTVLYAVYYSYMDKISLGVISVFIIVTSFCNLNYSLKILNKIENNEFDNNHDLNSFFLKKWSLLFKGISKEKRQHLSNITKYFDETMVIVIFILLVIYLHNK